jgi:hypothetical protein
MIRNIQRLEYIIRNLHPEYIDLLDGKFDDVVQKQLDERTVDKIKKI